MCRFCLIYAWVIILCVTYGCDSSDDSDNPNQQPQREWYVDNDNDGWGDPDQPTIMSSDSVAGRTTRSGDCNDANPLSNPEATEICDGDDNDCDGFTDGDDFDLREVCDGIDNDCDGFIDGDDFDLVEICDNEIDDDCDGFVDGDDFDCQP